MRHAPVVVVDRDGKERYLGIQVGGLDDGTDTVSVYNPTTDEFEAVHFQLAWEPTAEQAETVRLAYRSSAVGRDLIAKGVTTHGHWIN